MFISRNTKKKRESGSVAKKRQWRTFEEKFEIIKLYEKGASFAKIGREKGMDESSVRKIVKMKDQYAVPYGMATESYLSKKVTKNRSSRMINMERLLSVWIENLNTKRIPVTSLEIQTKALNIYNDLKQNEHESTKKTNETFIASRGWLSGFKKRNGIHIVDTVGENVTEEEEAALNYLQDEIIDATDIRAVMKLEPSISTTSLLNGTIKDPLSSCTIEKRTSETEPSPRSVSSDDAIILGELWAFEYSKLKPQQKVFAKKAISDILYTAGFEELHRNSVKINDAPHP